MINSTLAVINSLIEQGNSKVPLALSAAGYVLLTMHEDTNLVLYKSKKESKVIDALQTPVDRKDVRTHAAIRVCVDSPCCSTPRRA
jgi:hypothetical protein